MSDEPSFDFLPWEELPVGVRRNRKKMYNYLVSVLGGDTPTPTGTGTVTVTVQDSEQQPLKATNLFLCNTDQLDPEDDSNWVAIEDSGPSGTATLTIYDTATHQPTEETAIPFGSYYLFAIKANFETYSSALTVDGDENVTITLTGQGNTGTVTVTCQDSQGQPVDYIDVFLCDTNQMPSVFDDDNVVAFGSTEDKGTGIATLFIYDKETHQTTEVSDIPFDDYYLFASDEDQVYTYSGALTVDGDETVTITLTSE